MELGAKHKFIAGSSAPLHVACSYCAWPIARGFYRRVSVLPALKSLPATKVMCFYSVDELAAGDTACGASELAGATRVARPGGHHFDGDYDAVAKLIVERL